MKPKRIVGTLFQVIVFLAAFNGILRSQAPPANAITNTLVTKLCKELSVTPDQATGGAGAIFSLAKGRLNAADFSKVSAAVPGMGKFLRAAPEAGSTSTVTSLNSVVGGQAGGLASLAGSFQSLGLSPSMVGKFVPVLQNYIGSKGGSSTAAMFAGALK